MPSIRMIQILDDLDRHRHAFELDRHGLGEALMDVTAEEVLRGMDAETDPDGRTWDRLSRRYAAWKSTHFPGQPMAVLYGTMKTPEQVKGQRKIAPDSAVMEYGTDETAKQEAAFFQEGNSNQPERRFYGISAACEARLDAHCVAHLRGQV